MAAPTLTYRTLTGNEGLVDNFNEVENPVVQYRLGLDYGQQLTSRLSLLTGLRHLSMSTQSPEIPLIWPSELATGEFIDDPELPDVARFPTTDRYLEIPTRLRYVLGNVDNYLRPYIEGGVASLLYLNTRSTLVIDGTANTEEGREALPDYQRYQLALGLGAGLEYTRLDRIHFYVQPDFQHHVGSPVILATNTAFRRRPWVLALNVGVRWVW